jgi:hypothetical protein
MTYQDFIQTKFMRINPVGFEVNNLNPMLKDFQKFSVKVALHKGRFALFEDCGLGKTFQALEWSNHVSLHTGKPVLNLAPLAVVGQTIEEGKKFGIEVSEAGVSEGCIRITNYEQLENIDTSIYGGVVIDESSILKNFEGAYRNLIIERFRNTPFKLACSATPSPNDPMELGNHFEFLGIMNRNEMLSTYFVHDGGSTSSWRIKGHATERFWRDVASWSLMYSRPSDIGFEDDGYILPELNLIERQIITPKRNNGLLFNDVAVSATNFHHEVRLTKMQRLSEVIEIVNSSNESFIVWVEQNEEGDYLRKSLNGAVEVKGSDSPEFKKDKLLGFSKNQFRVLITKPKIASFGLNYQNCHNMVFASPDYSYEKMYQAIRRELRYGQSHAVNVFLITTDTMQNVITSLKLKEQQDREMKSQMIKYNKELYGQYSIAA